MESKIMQITDIIKDFSEMTEAELEEVIRNTRRSRTTAKAITLKKRPTKDTEKAKEDIEAALSKMKPEQLELLKKLMTM
jgi:hypothetical protein